MEKQQSADTDSMRSLITQVILLQSKAETSDEDLASFFKGVSALKRHISCLVAVSAGENQSARHRGFTHGILLHFENEARMRNAMQQATYRRMFEKAQQLSEAVIVLELSETLLFPAKDLETASISPNTVDNPSPKRGRPLKQRITTSSALLETEARTRMNTGMSLRQYPITSVDPRLKQIIIDQFNVEESAVTPSASLVGDLNADSLDLVEYIMNLEQLFQLTIPDEDAEKLTTVEETQIYLIAKGVLSRTS